MAQNASGDGTQKIKDLTRPLTDGAESKTTEVSAPLKCELRG